MAFLAGIDEAGYGPFVGPFVVGFSLFRVPRLEHDLWATLEPAATRQPGRKDPRVWLNDSKLVHRGPLGRGRLGRSVSAFTELLQPGLLPQTQSLAEFVGAPPCGPTEWWNRAPWLGRLDEPLCPEQDFGRARLDAAALRRALDDDGCSLDAFGCRMVPVGEWNECLERTGNKSETLFAITMEAVRFLLQRTAGAPMRIELDQHGARRHYARKLAQELQPDRVETHGETEGGSAYTLHFQDRTVQFRFSQKADENHAPVALASLAAKWIRERTMDRFNDWWGERLPELKPTKGYGVDGKRWLAEVEKDAGRFVGMEFLRRNK